MAPCRSWRRGQFVCVCVTRQAVPTETQNKIHHGAGNVVDVIGINQGGQLQHKEAQYMPTHVRTEPPNNDPEATWWRQRSQS